MPEQSKPNYVMCRAVVLSNKIIEGSMIRRCAKCRIPVFASPSSVSIAEEHRAEIRCESCVPKAAGRLAITRAQLVEIAGSRMIDPASTN